MNPDTRSVQSRQYAAFRCLGADCSDTCCSGWKLPVDKETFQKYQQSEDPAMGPLLRTLVTIQPGAASDHHYGEFILSQAACLFLSEGWCSIQQKLGEAYLSHACATFPRTANLVDGVLEHSLDLSCPAAVRLLLFNPDPLEFAPQAGSVCLPTTPGVLNTLPSKNPGRAYQQVAEVRSLVIWILQSRAYPPSHRLVLVGHVCDRLQKMADEGEDISAAVVEGFRTAVRLGFFNNHLSQIAARPASQLAITLKLIEQRTGADYVSPAFLSLFEDCKRGLGWSAESTLGELEQRYIQDCAEYYLPFIGSHEYLLEHYLVTYAFRTLFPYGSVGATGALGNISQPIYAQYALIATYFAILKTILIGLAGLHRSRFSPDHVAHAVQVCTKTLEHSGTFPARALQMLAAWGLTNPACMSVLTYN